MRFWQASNSRPAALFRSAMRGFPVVCALGALFLSPAASDAATGWRGGVHETFARLVFDLPTHIDFDASVVGNRLVVNFKSPLPDGFQASQLRSLSDYLKDPDISGDRRSVSFELLRPVTVRGFSTDTSDVVDLSDVKGGSLPTASATPTSPIPASSAPKADDVAPSGAPTVPVRVGTHSDSTRLVFDWPHSIDYKVTTDGPVVHIAFTGAGSVDAAQVRRRLPKAIGEFDASNASGSLVVSMTVPADAKLHDARDGNQVIVDVLASPDETPAITAAPRPAIAAAPQSAPAAPTPAPAPVASAPTPARVPTPAPAPPPAPLPAVAAATTPTAPPSLPPVDVSIKVSTTGGPSFKFPWKPLPGAAVYVSGGVLYIVFDQPAQFDFSEVRRNSDKIPPLEQLAVSQGAALDMTLPAGMMPQISRDADGWSIALRRQSARHADLPVESKADTLGSPRSLLTIDTEDAIAVIDVPDKQSGSALSVIPVGSADRGIEKERQFVQFNIVPSYQGAVIDRRADGLNIAVVNHQIQVGGARGAVLSKASGGAGSAKVYDFARWLQPDIKFTETRQALQRAVADADPGDRPSTQFELAQFFVARDHAADAIGTLNLIAETSPERASDPALKALRGAARVLLTDTKGALADLNDPRLDREPEVALWRAAAVAETEDWPKADEMFRKAGAIPASYPTEMRARLYLLEAEAALNTGDINRTRTVLLDFPGGSAPDYLVQRSQYLKARIRIAEGSPQLATPILNDLYTTGDDWARAHAEVLRVEQALSDQKISPKEAIDRLERVRYTWSGGELEYEILKKLGDLYLQVGDPRTGLQRLREAINYFPNKPDNAALKSHLTDAFVGIYTNDDADKIPALTALSVYDDFRDLTPTGPSGDLMIQRLADRLVKIDLLDRAAELLDYQVHNRLSGADRARVGLRLAIIDLLDRKPDDAISAIDYTIATGLPADLAAERHRIRARGLMETGQADHALAELAGDTSREADIIRAESFAKVKNWSKTSEALARLVGNPNQGAWTPGREQLVLKLAITLVLAGDSNSLAKLRDDFQGKFEAGPDKDAFQGLTSGDQPTHSIDMAALSVRFAELAQFQTAMDGYRETLKNGKLSAIN